MPLDRNFSFIVGVARSQTKRSSSKAMRTIALRLGGRVELIKYTTKIRYMLGFPDMVTYCTGSLYCNFEQIG